MKHLPANAETETVTSLIGRTRSTPAVPYSRNRRSVNRPAQLVHHSSALDPRSSATRRIVWLSFVVGVLWVAVLVTSLLAPKPVAPATWSATVPGSLKLSGKPSVSTAIVDASTVSFELSGNGSTSTYRVTVTDPANIRTFWRGDNLVIDAADTVWRIDTKHDLLLRAPQSFAWPMD